MKAVQNIYTAVRVLMTAINIKISIKNIKQKNRIVGFCNKWAHNDQNK